MNVFRKAFLLMVGAVVVAYEETSKALDEAAKSLEDRREQFGGWSRRRD